MGEGREMQIYEAVATTTIDPERMLPRHKIFKYEVQIADVQRIRMPIDSRIISCVAQDDYIYLYAIVDPSSAPAKRLIIVAGTGNPVRAVVTESKFLATVQTHNGRLVWHVFDAGWNV